MDVKTKIEKLENAQIKLDIEVPASDIDREFDLAYKQIGSQVKIPGFRPGKVPKNIVRQRFGPNVKSQAFEKIVSTALDSAVRKEELKIISQPHIDEIDSMYEKLNENQDFSFQAKVEIYPSVELGDYKTIKIEAPNYTYSQEHIDYKLQEFQKKSSESEKKENGLVEDGDSIQFQYQFYLVAKEEGKNHIHYWNLNEDSAWFDPIKSDVIGMKIGDEKDIPVTIPSDYTNENLHGRDGNVYIKITEIEHVVLPPIDDELAKDFNYETLDELKENLQKSLKDQCDKKRRDEVIDKILDQIIEVSQFDLGQSAIEMQVEQHINRLEVYLQRFKMSLDDYLASNNQSEDDIRNDFKEQAEKDIKIDLIMDMIGETEKVEATDEDVDEGLKEYAEQMGMTFEEVKKNVAKPNDLRAIREVKVKEKIVDMLIDSNEIENTKDEPIFEIPAEGKLIV